MKSSYMIAGLMAGILGTATVVAQAPVAEPTDPSAASTPHQRDTVKKQGDEAPAVGATTPSDAATPHQKQVTKKKHKKKSNEGDTPSS